jgi:hypothetical protein
LSGERVPSRPRLELRAEAAAHTSEDEETAEHDGDRVNWMTKEEDEALNCGNLHEEKGKANRQEVDGDAPSVRRRCGASAVEPQWRQDNHEAKHTRRHQRREQDKVTAVKQYSAA